MGYQNDPDGTRNDFSYVSEIGPKMWYQDGNCAHFGFYLGTKSPMMDPPNHAQCVQNICSVCQLLVPNEPWFTFTIGSFSLFSYFATFSCHVDTCVQWVAMCVL